MGDQTRFGRTKEMFLNQVEADQEKSEIAAIWLAATSLTGDGNTAEAEFVLDGPDVCDGVGGRQRHGFSDETILEPGDSF